MEIPIPLAELGAGYEIAAVQVFQGASEDIGELMTHKEPTLDEWKRLYAAADAFRDLACWEWMRDTDIFGVLDPARGEVDYCCVLGNNKELRGLLVFPGTAGLMTHSRILESKGDIIQDPDLPYIQLCTALTFEDRALQTDQDLRTIKELGLQFRGKDAWPLFRDFTPGSFPWYLDSGQAGRLTDVIEQAMAVAVEFKEDRRLLHPEDKDEDAFLVRTPSGTHQGKKGGHGGPGTGWKNEWRKPAGFRPDRLDARSVKVNERDLAKADRATMMPGLVWEMDARFIPKLIRDGDARPYFAMATLIMDSGRGLVLDFKLVRPPDQYRTLFKGLFRTVAKMRVKPESIVVRDEMLCELFKEAVSDIGIHVHLNERLDAIDDFITSFRDHGKPFDGP